MSVASGRYSRKVTINKAGTASAPVTITTSEGAVLTSMQQGFDLVGASWVTLSGFTVDNTIWEGIRCTLCLNVTTANNTVKNARGNGICINNSNNLTLSSNRIEDSSYIGINVAGTSNIAISNGYVTRSGLRTSGRTKSGIKFGTTTSSLVDGTEIYNNSDTGIYIADGSHGICLKRVKAHHNKRSFQRIAAGIE